MGVQKCPKYTDVILEQPLKFYTICQYNLFELGSSINLSHAHKYFAYSRYFYKLSSNCVWLGYYKSQFQDLFILLQCIQRCQMENLGCISCQSKQQICFKLSSVSVAHVLNNFPQNIHTLKCRSLYTKYQSHQSKLFSLI